MEKEEEDHNCIDLSFMPSCGSDVDFDDDLGVPNSVKIIEVDGAPVAIEHHEEEASETAADQLPFSVIHNPPVKFSSFHRDVFIPGVDIIATIIDYERNLTTHLLNPNL